MESNIKELPKGVLDKIETEVNIRLFKTMHEAGAYSDGAIFGYSLSSEHISKQSASIQELYGVLEKIKILSSIESFESLEEINFLSQQALQKHSK